MIKKLYKITMRKLQEAFNKDDLDYYELVLDRLLRKAIRSYKSEQNNELQEV